MENQMIFKDEESRLEPITIGMIVYAGVQAIVTSGIAITKKKRANEEAARQARQRYYEALVKLNDQRKSERKKKITTEALAGTAIVLVLFSNGALV